MYFRVIFVTKSMTEGKPLKLILQFAVPLLLGNLLQQMYNLVDAAIVGRVLGTGALAAVGATSSVQFLVLGFCIGICIGFGIPIAKSFGAERLDKMRSYIFNSVLLTALFAVLITAVCSLCCTLILQMLSVPQDVFDDAYAYLIVIFLGIPFTLLYNLLSSILRSVGDSRTPFLFLAISTVLNIGLDLLCIIVFKWGVAGAAIATIAAQAAFCASSISASACRSSRFPAQTAKRMPNPSVTSSSWASPWGFKPPSQPSAAWSCRRRTTASAACTFRASRPVCA